MPYQLPHLLAQCSYCLESSMRGLHPCFQLIVMLIFEISLTTRLLNFHFHLHCLRQAIGCRLFPALKMTQEICNSVVISLHFIRILRSLFNINTLMFPKIWLTELHIIAFNMYIHVLVPVYITFFKAQLASVQFPTWHSLQSSGLLLIRYITILAHTGLSLDVRLDVMYCGNLY